MKFTDDIIYDWLLNHMNSRNEIDYKLFADEIVDICNKKMKKDPSGEDGVFSMVKNCAKVACEKFNKKFDTDINYITAFDILNAEAKIFKYFRDVLDYETLKSISIGHNVSYHVIDHMAKLDPKELTVDRRPLIASVIINIKNEESKKVGA